MSLWPTLLFYKSLHFFKKDYSFSPILHCPHGFQQFLTHNFYSQFLPTIFSQISTDLHRSSQVYLAIQPLFFSNFLLGTQSPRSSLIFHRSFKDLSKNFSSSIPFHLVPGQSVIPAHSPVFHRSSQIFTDLSCHSTSIYPFSTRYSVSKIFTDLPQIFQRSFKNFPSSIPFHLVPGQSVIPAHSPDLQVFPLFSYLYISSQVFNRSSKTFILLASLASWYLDSRSFRPTLQISKLFVSSLFPTFCGRSSTGLPKFSLPLSPSTYYLDSWSFRPTLQFSTSLHFLSYSYTSSQIFHRSSKRFFFLLPLLLCFWTVGHPGPLSCFPFPLLIPLFPHSSSSIFH